MVIVLEEYFCVELLLVWRRWKVDGFDNTGFNVDRHTSKQVTERGWMVLKTGVNMRDRSVPPEPAPTPKQKIFS